MYLIPRKNIEINAKGSRGVVIHYLERIYMFLLRIRNRKITYNSSNIRSLLVDHDYVMMLMIYTQLIVKRDNCEQEVLLHGVR